jgi:predicted nucleic acid-binding protein
MMKKVFLDTNVLIDYLARRGVHHKLPNEVVVQKFAQFVKMCNVTPVDSLTIDEAHWSCGWASTFFCQPSA